MMSLHLPLRRLLRHAAVRPLLASSFAGVQPVAAERSLLPLRSLSTTPSCRDDRGGAANIAKQKRLWRQAQDKAAIMEGSIWDQDIRDFKTKEAQSMHAASRSATHYEDPHDMANQRSKQRDPRMYEWVRDPDPRARIRWERKKVIQMVRAGNHLTREEKIRQTERQLVFKSRRMRTSTKKLMFLARQVAGKTLEEAETQMQFSKKKFAAHVLDHLQKARDFAVVHKGMGLGVPNGEVFTKPKNIETKDGRGVTVDDPTRMYIDQAWVGRGKYLRGRVYRHGRGRKSQQWRPQATITLLLKEEKTRIRQHNERELASIKAKPWVHHPNRPIYGQKQYYKW